MHDRKMAYYLYITQTVYYILGKMTKDTLKENRRKANFIIMKYWRLLYIKQANSSSSIIVILVWSVNKTPDIAVHTINVTIIRSYNHVTI